MKAFDCVVASLAIATIAALTIAPLFSFSSSVQAFSLTNTKKLVRIMPLGDSNTRGKEPGVLPGKRGGYRDDLWALFQDQGFNVNFVGGLKEGPSAVQGSQGTYTFDGNHEGHGGFAIKGSGGKGEILPNVTNWLKKAMPDVVLLMTGTNDFIYQKTTAEETRDELRELIDKIFSWASNVELFVATIPPIKPSRTFATEARKYNDLIASLLNEPIYKDKKIHFVDTRKQLTVSDLWSSASDTVHLNNQGYKKLAKSWFDAIVDAAKPGQSPVNQKIAAAPPESVSESAFAWDIPEDSFFNNEAEATTMRSIHSFSSYQPQAEPYIATGENFKNSSSKLSGNTRNYL
ncbi:SGNH/GDSL hydrolase family protein [Aerosakkonemataceae cyanobacterium BLCC-F154]|uniref:SGNH/GDSL hydrolase family protein n=1 Tax=Floridaenema fluviatile BLCC-F154 TaxID=3153640 RepID=A0ABV4Y878_9CYAN